MHKTLDTYVPACYYVDQFRNDPRACVLYFRYKAVSSTAVRSTQVIGTIMKVPSFLRIAACKLGLLFFPLLKIVVPGVRAHPCYWRTMLRFHAMRVGERERSRINFCLQVGPSLKPSGHCWLTIDDESVEELPLGLEERLERVGASAVCNYWVVRPRGEAVAREHPGAA